MVSSGGPKLTILGKLVIALIVAGSLYGAYMLLGKGKISLPDVNIAGPGGLGGKKVSVGIAYGTEKKNWLEWAVEEYAKTKEGKRVNIELIPMGSLEAAQAIRAEDTRINVWSPASSLYKDAFVQDWQVEHSENPIAKEETLALTPMVFVMWKERFNAYMAKYQEVSFRTVSAALSEKGGWSAIAGKPDWGLFKFGHTDPNQSNSGLMTLVLMAYEFHGKTKGLSMDDILDIGFQERLKQFGVSTSGMQHSTGTLVKDMVLKGPSTYDSVFVYENVAIDYIKSAEGRWGALHVVYPVRNMWNDNPYYVLNVDWSTSGQKKAASTFCEYLMSEPIQKKALEHGFRPGNPSVPIRFPQSPFVKLSDYGLKVDVPTICEPPNAQVINNMLESWQRTQSGR